MHTHSPNSFASFLTKKNHIIVINQKKNIIPKKCNIIDRKSRLISQGVIVVANYFAKFHKFLMDDWALILDLSTLQKLPQNVA